MTPEQWRKKKAKETEALSKKEFGRMGPKGFKSRSLQSFQEDLEKGKTGVSTHVSSSDGGLLGNFFNSIPSSLWFYLTP
jgi:hypothetical protein